MVSPGGRPRFLDSGLAGALLLPPILAACALKPSADTWRADAAAHDDGLTWRRGRAAPPPQSAPALGAAASTISAVPVGCGAPGSAPRAERQR